MPCTLTRRGQWRIVAVAMGCPKTGSVKTIASGKTDPMVRICQGFPKMILDG